MTDALNATEAPPNNRAHHNGKFSLARMAEPIDGIPTWMTAMRKAAVECITEADVKEIVQGQVKRAKEGDRNAIRFVFEQVLGGAGQKASTFIQNNYGNGAAAEDPAGVRPDKPTKAIPGTKQKIEAIRRRVEAGLDACNIQDGPGGDLE